MHLFICFYITGFVRNRGIRKTILSQGLVIIVSIEWNTNPEWTKYMYLQRKKKKKRNPIDENMEHKYLVPNNFHAANVFSTCDISIKNGIHPQQKLLEFPCDNYGIPQMRFIVNR